MHSWCPKDSRACLFFFLQTAHGAGKNRTTGHVGLRDMVDETRVFEAVSGDNTAKANDAER